MIGIILGVIVALCIVYALWFVSGETASGAEELDGAKLVLNEKTLRINKPIKLSGRPDQVWQLKSGALVIVDTKTRANGRVYEKDRVQLSAYKLLIKHSRFRNNSPVSDYAYLRIDNKGQRPRFVKVGLFGEDEIIARYKRAQALKKQITGPTGNPSPALCRGCGHRKKCSFV